VRGRIAILLAILTAGALPAATAAADTELTCRGRPVTIVGTHGDERIMGTEGPDVIHARGGDDFVFGLGGNDVICGGSGNDRLFGGDGRDTLVGNGGNDRLEGGADRDLLFGIDGDDTLLGQGGPDRIFGGGGADALHGADGADLLVGGPGADSLSGGAGADDLRGNGSDDVLVAGLHDDLLDGGTGFDRCAGDRGFDTAANCERVDGTEAGQVPEPRVRPRPGRVALTFDDGPSAANTPGVLAALDRYGVKATFFVIGQSADANPGLIREMIRRGHSVQNHTWSHAWLTRYSNETVAAELIAGAAAIERITGVEPPCWRPPAMAYSDRVDAVANSLGYRRIMWDVDPWDWKHPGPSAVASHVLRYTGDGDIVLFHDTVGYSTTNALPAIIEGLRARGLEFDTLCN
jgi:peptidoglycan/xylan/chitin deacetylase (PgdA/CDA1 family)